MIFLKALRRLKRLSADQQKTIRAQSISGRHSFRVWLRLLRGIGEFDSLRDKSMWSLGWCIAGAIALFIFNVFLAFSIPNESPLAKLVILAIPFTILALVWLFHVLVKLSSSDIHNSVREFAYPFLRVLAIETSYFNKVALELKLRGRLDLRNKTYGPAALVKTLPGRIKPTETKFEYEWLRLSTMLADQTKLQLSITDFIRQVHFQKRGRSGKIKSKTKYKVVVKMEASFLPPGQSEWVHEERKVKSTDIEFKPQLETLLQMISTYYRQHPPKEAIA